MQLTQTKRSRKKLLVPSSPRSSIAARMRRDYMGRRFLQNRCPAGRGSREAIQRKILPDSKYTTADGLPYAYLIYYCKCKGNRGNKEITMVCIGNIFKSDSSFNQKVKKEAQDKLDDTDKDYQKRCKCKK